MNLIGKCSWHQTMGNLKKYEGNIVPHMRDKEVVVQSQ